MEQQRGNWLAMNSDGHNQLIGVKWAMGSLPREKWITTVCVCVYHTYTVQSFPWVVGCEEVVAEHLS